MSRFHLHALSTASGVKFQTRETDDEQEAAAVAAMLAGQSWAVWLYRHDHDHHERGAGEYVEVGMFVGRVFLPRR